MTSKKSLDLLELTASKQRDIAEALRNDYSMRQIYETLGFNKSSLYYRPKINPSEEALQEEIERLSLRHPKYGYRRLTAELVRMGNHKVGYRRVARLMKSESLCVVSVKRICQTTTSLEGERPWINRLKNLEISRCDQVWVADITYIRLQANFVYVLALMDVFTRMIRAWHLSHHLNQSLAFLRKKLVLTLLIFGLNERWHFKKEKQKASFRIFTFFALVVMTALAALSSCDEGMNMTKLVVSEPIETPAQPQETEPETAVIAMGEIKDDETEVTMEEGTEQEMSEASVETTEPETPQQPTDNQPVSEILPPEHVRRETPLPETSADDLAVIDMELIFILGGEGVEERSMHPSLHTHLGKPADQISLLPFHKRQEAYNEFILQVDLPSFIEASNKMVRRHNRLVEVRIELITRLVLDNVVL